MVPGGRKGGGRPGKVPEPAEPAGQPSVRPHPADSGRPGRCPKCKLPGPVKRGWVYANKGMTKWYRCGCTFVWWGGLECMRKPNRAEPEALNDSFKGHLPVTVAGTLKSKGRLMHLARTRRIL